MDPIVDRRKRRRISSKEKSVPSTSTSPLPANPGRGDFISTLTEELTGILECPVCFEIVSTPIMQCEGGHLICASCRRKLLFCPVCRGTLGITRNLAVEKIANKYSLTFPCKHKNAGCKRFLKLNEKAEHEDECEFRPYTCPYPYDECSWQGQLEEVIGHLQAHHKHITIQDGEDVVFLAKEINKENISMHWEMIQNCYDQHFILVFQKRVTVIDEDDNEYDTQFFGVVRLIGPRKDSEKFIYRLELKRNGRCLSWQARPTSTHEDISLLFMKQDCLTFDDYTSQYFIDSDNLSIQSTISLCAK